LKKENVLEKVKKLFAVAENNPYLEEAQNAILRAQFLMLKHGVTVEDIDFQEGKKEVVDESIAETGRMPWYWKSLMMVLGDNFRCKAYIQKRNISKACFIGLKEDVKLVKEVFNYAVNVVEVCAKNYVVKYKKPGFNTSGIKNDYILGFINGLKDKFKEQVESKGFALMLVKDNAVIEAIENRGLKKGQRSNFLVNRNQDARDAGYQRGRNFQNPNRVITDY